MTLIAILLSIITTAIAVVHILWGIGFWWPIRDEEALVRTVVGFKGITRMPGPIPCALVAVGLICAANFPWFPHGILRNLGLWASVVVFLGRGAITYAPFWRALTPEQPFSRLDRSLYGPLCLLLAAGYLTLVLGAT